MAAPRMVTQGISGVALADFAAEVRAGLRKPGQKELPSKYFYDEIGSALFEVICLLPEYGLTRACQRLLERCSTEVIERLPLPVVVAELGSGTGKKTRLILEALSRRQPVNYYPIDISRSALDLCERELSGIRAVSVVGFERAYLDGLLEVAARRRGGERLFVLFLGSNIGNFDRPAGEEFLREVRQILQRGDTLLLSADLEKGIHELLLAYDDPAGVTAAFNLNLLARINRELDANFDLAQFEHAVRYNEAERRIEMHLRSTSDQVVRIPMAGCTATFRKGETIWTENSQKFNREELVQMAQRTGFRCEAQWVDVEWPFAQNLWVAA
jgi:L-histidine N-alpha-methyltransferase